jgi:hypothetical protein
MSTTLKINLSAVGNGCEQDTTPGNIFPGNGWFVFLNRCDGKPFVHAGKQYGPFSVNHGYVEIKDVPRGKYLLFAIVNPFPVNVHVPGGELVYQSNFASHFAVVDVCDCCDDMCITLYNSGWHYCVTVIIEWFLLQVRHGALDAAVAEPAIAALTRAAEAAGETQPGDAHIIRQIRELTAQFREQADDRKQ